VLDDLQWAGADALDLLAALSRAETTPPLRFVAAYRDSEAAQGTPLAGTLADLAQAGLALQHTLDPLSAAEVGQLLERLVPEGTPGETLRAQVAQRTGGVPFFVLSCAQVLRLEGGIWQGAEAVPWTVAQSVRQRVAALAPPAQGVLEVAAVLGREVQPALLAAVAAQAEDAVIETLEAAHRLRLLDERKGAYWFAHDLVREVVEADVGPARRRALHRRAGEALESVAGEPPVVLLAYHFARGDAHDKALLYLERAGDHAEAQFAHASAADYYGEMLERLEQAGQQPEAPRIREKLAAVLRLLGRYAAALAALEPAAEHHSARGDLDSLARVVAQMGQIHSEAGTPAEGLRRVQALVERLEAPEPSRGLAQLYLALTDLLHTGYARAALAAAARACELARVLGDQHLLAAAQMAYGLELGAAGRASEARAAVEGAAVLAEAVGDLKCLSRALNILAHLYLHLADFPASLQYVERALVVAERIDDARNLAFETMHRGAIYFCYGDWGRTRADAERAAALCDAIGPSYISAFPYMVLGYVSYAEGDWAEAVGHLEHAVALAESRSAGALLMSSSMLAEIEVRERRPAAARTRLLALLERFEPESAVHAYLLPKLAWAHLELGDLAQAETVAAQSVAFAQRIEDFLNLVDARRAQALVLMEQLDWTEAEGILAEMLAETRRRRYPWGEARVLDTLALLHRRSGAREAARDRLAAALTIYQRLGARKEAQRLTVELSGITRIAGD
jgi:tetratricopeptide (TPR) repeat protein